MAHIENLSNEIFYEIFDYLYDWEISHGFLNLNTRFDNLIYSCHSMKIDICKQLETIFSDYCNQVIIPRKNRIISLRFSDKSMTEKFFGLFRIDSTFSCLKSLIINGIHFRNTFVILQKAILLPCLSSLTVSFPFSYSYRPPCLRHIYKWILCLPVLKYCKISIESPHGSLSTFSPSINGGISSIEHLIINHRFTNVDLLHLLSYTPKLCHLDCKFIQWLTERVGDVSIHLPNLRYISMSGLSIINFNACEIFFQRIQSPIEVLCFKASYYGMYCIDANRWEQLILQHMPQLQKFYLQATVIFYSPFRDIEAHRMSNGFTSCFWTKRQWIFQLKVDVNNNHRIQMTYEIQPNKSRSICSPLKQLQSDVDDQSFHLSQSAELLLCGNCSIEDYRLFISNNKLLFSTIQFSHVNMDYIQPSSEFLIELSSVLPNINCV